jgi:hypothetical protein
MKLFLIAITLVIFVSCKKETTVDTQTIALNNCSEEPVESLAYRLCFDSLLEDSRCPANAVCVWQGAAKAKFLFKVNNQEHVVRLSTISMAPHYSTDATVAGYHLKLVNILPYPVYPNTPPAQVTATVEITQ